MTTTVSVEQTIEAWGDGLGVRIPEQIATAAQFSRGSVVRMEAVNGGIFLRAVSKPQRTLAQKLKMFDPAVHSGEAMASGRVDAEVA